VVNRVLLRSHVQERTATRVVTMTTQSRLPNCPYFRIVDAYIVVPADLEPKLGPIEFCFLIILAACKKKLGFIVECELTGRRAEGPLEKAVQTLCGHCTNTLD